MAKGAKTGGRQKGSVNKTTAEIRETAQVHGPAAIAMLVTIMQESENENARIAAAKEILDRGYGKSTQPVEHGGTLDIRRVERVVIKPGE